ncbi:hypothetical protein BHE74_00003823 [Ensete ventricosum]|nr:hypothetical protein BHE74_00003823 [Ensete ventricosum]
MVSLTAQSHLSFALVAPLPQPLIVPITLLLGRSSTSFTTEIHYCSSSGDCYLLVIGRSLFFVTTIDLRYSTALQGATARSQPLFHYVCLEQAIVSLSDDSK